MAKPWARYEIGFIRHRKFLALNANAICLWLEGKDYADSHATDGLLPMDVVQQFRFYSKKAAVLLTTSVGQKSEHDTYAALWEPHVVGFKMHDYLDHNDCREAVLARIAAAEQHAAKRRDYDRDYKAQMRLGKAAKAARLSSRHASGQTSGHASGRRVDVYSLSTSITETETESERTQEREKSASLSPAALLKPAKTTGSPNPEPPATATGHDPRRDPFTDSAVTERAGRFLDRYPELYAKHRHGARYALKPTRDYAAAVTLCETWTEDTRLDDLAVIFLTTDHKFAEEGSRTVPQFLALASWCDGKLAEHRARNGAGV